MEILFLYLIAFIIAIAIQYYIIKYAVKNANEEVVAESKRMGTMLSNQFKYLNPGVIECRLCNNLLSKGVTACPKCGEVVKQDQ